MATSLSGCDQPRPPLPLHTPAPPSSSSSSDPPPTSRRSSGRPSPSSSPDTSPTTTRARSAVGWVGPQSSHYSCVSPSLRPSTAIGWESRRKDLDAGRGCKKRRFSSPVVNRVLVEDPGQASPGEEEECDGGGMGRSGAAGSPGCSHGSAHKLDLLALMQSKKKPKDKFRQLIGHLMKESSEVVMNSTGEHNMTALHFAVLNGDKLCVETLVAFGANINAKNSFNQTPLDVASENQQDHLVPFLVSIGCRRGRNLPETSAHHPTRRRAVSSPHEPPSIRKLNSPDSASRRKSGRHFEFGGGASDELTGQSDSVLSEQLETHINRRFEATQSVKPDEAFAIYLQQREIAKYRLRCPNTANHEATHPCPASPHCNATPKSQTPPTSPMMSCSGGSRILSLDGGGVRALIQIDILFELERLTGKKITQLFDWIIGTSSGGILALALVYRQMSVSHLRSLYFRLKEEVFSKGRVGFSYDSARLEELLKEQLGTELRMGDITHPKVLVCAVDKSSIPLKLNFFNNCFDDEFSHQHVWKVARYTSAAPMYFTECDNYVDGGVMANNPCIDGLNKIQSFYQERHIHYPIACMMSVGSGVFPPEDLGSVDFQGILRLKFAGMFRKAQSLVNMLSSAIGESEALADRCQRSCEVQNIPFFRFNPQLAERIGPGVTDNGKLLQMIITTRIYTHTQMSQLDRLLAILNTTESK